MKRGKGWIQWTVVEGECGREGDNIGELTQIIHFDRRGRPFDSTPVRHKRPLVTDLKSHAEFLSPHPWRRSRQLYIYHTARPGHTPHRGRSVPRRRYLMHLMYVITGKIGAEFMAPAMTRVAGVTACIFMLPAIKKIHKSGAY